MRWPRPRSLAAQLAVLLVFAVFAAQIPASIMFARGSTAVGRAAFKKRIGERIIVLTRVLRVVPSEDTRRVVASFNEKDFRFSIDRESAVPDGAMSSDEQDYTHFLAHRIGPGVGPVRVFLGSRDPAGSTKARAWPDVLRVSVRLANDRWLNGDTYLFQETPLWLRNTIAHVVASVLAILAVLAVGLRGIVEPVSALAMAAERAGRGEPVEALPERGPRELRTMTASFNLMQARLHAYVENRSRVLAAISHDLRTPIASLRIRAEMVEEEELREAMVCTLDEMRQMVEAVLSLARHEASEEQSTDLDMSEMTRAVVADHRALGSDVTLTAPSSVPFHGRAHVLRRAIDNLVGNAVRYGGCARVSLSDHAALIRVRVDDSGPGVPEDRIEEMFLPFARLEGSRCSDTGGTGLGLAIVRSSIRIHGGDVTLSNLQDGGLRAEVVLPKRTPPTNIAALALLEGPAP